MGSKHLQERAFHSCATCDGAFFKNQDLVVVGGGDSAIGGINFSYKICIVNTSCAQKR